MPGVRRPVFGAAAFQVADDGQEGRQPETGLGDLEDKGLRVG